MLEQAGGVRACPASPVSASITCCGLQNLAADVDSRSVTVLRRYTQRGGGRHVRSQNWPHMPDNARGVSELSWRSGNRLAHSMQLVSVCSTLQHACMARLHRMWLQYTQAKRRPICIRHRAQQGGTRRPAALRGCPADLQQRPHSCAAAELTAGTERIWSVCHHQR